jgi:hypothetical protein
LARSTLILSRYLLSTLASVLVLLAGCTSTTYLYGEPASSLADIAVLSGPSEVVLLEIDGRTLPQPSLGGLTPVDGWEVHVQPGEHEIIVFLNSAYHKTRTSLSCHFDQGKRYSVEQGIKYDKRRRPVWAVKVYANDSQEHGKAAPACSLIAD